MPQLTRHYCTNCKESVYNCMIDGVRVPLLFYLVVGATDDVGDVDVNAPGFKVPSFVRELMATSLPRLELCMKCLAEIFGLALVTAGEDPMYDANNNKIPDVLELNDPGVSKTERFAKMHFRVLHAVKVGRGQAMAEDLPELYRPPLPVKRHMTMPELLAALSDSQREDLEARIAEAKEKVRIARESPPGGPA